MDDLSTDVTPSATFVSLFNGVMALAVLLARRGLMNEEEAQNLNDYMTRPLDYPDAGDTPGIGEYRKQIEALTAELLNQIRKNPDVPVN